MSAFSKLKKQNTDFSELADKLKKQDKGNSFQKDERFYYPDRDKEGNGYAVIRFLPAPPDEEFPFVKTFSHSFQGPGGYYIENCPTTIGKECPVCEMNSAEVSQYGKWDDTPESVKATIRKRSRGTYYISNVLVIKDSKNPENEGKVFLFKYGKKIFEKVMSAIEPTFEDDSPIDPFSFWEGADFKLKIRKHKGQTNYDESGFDVKRVLDSDDSVLEEIWNKEYKLEEFVSEDVHKDHDKLESHMNKVLGMKTNKVTQEAPKEEDDMSDSESEEMPEMDSAESAMSDIDDGDSDDTLSFFESLEKEEENS